MTACDGRVTTPTVELAVPIFGSCDRCGLWYRRDAPAFGQSMDCPWLLVGPVNVAYGNATDGMRAEVATDVSIDPPSFRVAGQPSVLVMVRGEIISIERMP